jgi:hypothetical protein
LEAVEDEKLIFLSGFPLRWGQKEAVETEHLYFTRAEFKSFIL